MPENIFRSETVHLYQLFLQEEAAFDCLSKLGELGCVEFKDLNAHVNAFHRTFVGEVRRCDEIERQLRYLHAELKKESIEVLDADEDVELPHPREFNNLEQIFVKLDSDVRHIRENTVCLKKNHLELIEIHQLLLNSNDFFKDSTLSTKQNVLHDTETENVQSSTGLGIITGVILRERMPAFERMIWRICRGNVFIRISDIPEPLEDPMTGEAVFKSLFILFHHGGELNARILKVCSGFHATVYNIPDTHAERLDMFEKVCVRMADLQTVLDETHEHTQRVLTAVGSKIGQWQAIVHKTKAIYHHMNMFNADMRAHTKCLIGEAWIPAADVERVRVALRQGRHEAGTDVPQVMTRLEIEHGDTPPTFNRSNKFTAAFQTLIDAYGVNSYREMNPASYATITFPFLFAVMFGDFGHALIISGFAIWMVSNERKIIGQKSTNEIWNIFFGGRYVILMMGMFAMYTGLIYNDIFGNMVNLFGSAWSISESELRASFSSSVQSMDPRTECARQPYPFGIDPAWGLADDNQIAFLNSFKMKMSILLGVSQMLFGVCMSLTNYLFYKDYASIVFLFVPQIIFLCALFVYLCALMVIKWFLYSTHNEHQRSERCAPLILITFIDMMLFKKHEAPADCGPPEMYANQAELEKILLLGGLATVPIMLLGKPLWVIRQRRALANQGIDYREHSTGGREDGDLSELMINQAIHTIEYVLGSVSHTASYLRLWALSLAHAQLSEVLWGRVLVPGMTMGTSSTIGLFAYAMVFAVWAVLTISILVVMEGMSAFLHTLRLHWVEFQSKFYEGNGRIFRPFYFKEVSTM